LKDQPLESLEAIEGAEFVVSRIIGLSADNIKSRKKSLSLVLDILFEFFHILNSRFLKDSFISMTSSSCRHGINEGDRILYVRFHYALLL